MQMKEAVSAVLGTTKQETEIRARWAWVEASVWTDRMLAALENGVKGGQWFSVMDKVYASATLEAAWQRVVKNKGSAGIDKMSIEKFASRKERYLTELQEALRQGTYQPLPVKRVYIPKPGGGERPLVLLC